MTATWDGEWISWFMAWCSTYCCNDEHLFRDNQHHLTEICNRDAGHEGRHAAEAEGRTW